MSELDRKLYFRVAFLALLLPLASGGCINLDLGMERGSIPDSKITTSSVQSANTPAKNGRLNFASGLSWCAGTSYTNPYLQIDLQTLHIICAVSTQGNSQADQWVTNYTLQSSTDGSTWKNYTEIGEIKTLKGNSDKNSEVKHILHEVVLARYLRFLPKSHHGGVCLRTEVFGVKQKPGKPVAKDLPKRTIFAVGELAILTCDISGDPEPSVTWSKDGDTNIPRAQFRYNRHILVIEDVLHVDSGVYECKASNKFGESRTSTTLIVAVPPVIIEDISPPSVTCERQTLCSLSCHATSGTTFNYSWTKNGQVPVSDNITIMNNSLVLTPRDAMDYGVYICHATNSFGSTAYNITLSESQKSSTCADTIKGDDNANSIITLSFIMFVSLVVNGVLIWRLRRAVRDNRTTTEDKAITDDIGQPGVSEPSLYMEIRPRPSEGRPRVPSECRSLQEANNNPECYNVGGNGNELDLSRDQQLSSKEQSREPLEDKSPLGTKENPGCYNVGFNKGNSGNEHGEISDEVYIAMK
ncbi:hypothetical protein ACROYT_G043236 [Oculina patagonica]